MECVLCCGFECACCVWRVRSVKFGVCDSCPPQLYCPLHSWDITRYWYWKITQQCGDISSFKSRQVVTKFSQGIQCARFAAVLYALRMVRKICKVRCVCAVSAKGRMPFRWRGWRPLHVRCITLRDAATRLTFPIARTLDRGEVGLHPSVCVCVCVCVC